MKTKHILFATVGLILLNIYVLGQVKVVTKAEFDEIITLRQNIPNQSRIVTTTRKRYKGGKISNDEKVEIKYETKKRNHWVTSKLVDGKYKITEEIIYYDDREFRQKANNKWMEINRTAGGGFDGIDSSDEIKIEEIEQYAIANIYMNEKPTRLFSTYRVLKIKNRLVFNNNNEFVDREGNIVASKYIISEVFPENITYIAETKYEYDPKNLKIKIPKL